MSAAYAAFLRGINVGGKSILKMTDLKASLEAAGFTDVTTILASGNAVFTARGGTPETIAKKIEASLKARAGRDIGVLVRAIADLERLAASAPFKDVKVTPDTRRYVTLLSEKPSAASAKPSVSPDGSFRVLRVGGGVVAWMMTLTDGRGTTDVMKELEKRFGKKITTRNWNTIEKVLKTGR